MKILVIGSGGREHCLAWKIAQSPLAEKIYCAPGNGGTSLIAENVAIAGDNIGKLCDFALKEKIGLTVVGPEIPLAAGIVDCFQEKGLKIFGPARDLARLEGSKIFAKQTMRKYNVPTADFEVFDDFVLAKEYINKKGAPLVVKADGLAAGKGVVICNSLKEAEQAVERMLVDKVFGFAGEKIIIEDVLLGQEASILAFTDGEEIIPLVPSQDHKRIFDGDHGPNTGGMGAYSPAPVINDVLFDKIMKKVFHPLISGLKSEGKIYKGIIYGGLMISNNEPSVLEFNVRFGDPETQAILPKLKSDLVDVMLKVIAGELGGLKLEWDERNCLCVVLASGGYPDSYEKGKVIKGLSSVSSLQDVFVFHAGTKQQIADNRLQIADKKDRKIEFMTDGGRVLNIVALGDTIREAHDKVYNAVRGIKFDDMFYRKDIGYRALENKR